MKIVEPELESALFAIYVVTDEDESIQELAVADGNGIIKLYGPLKDNLKELRKYDSVAPIDIFDKVTIKSLFFKFSNIFKLTF